MLIEYLYYDEKRLDSYLEQFASPVHFEKFSQWTASLNLGGPSAKRTQVSFARPLTKHEKVDGFTKFIVDQDLIVGHPERTNFESFVDQTIRTRRFVIEEENLAIWVSITEPDAPRDDRCIVFLIEDFSSNKHDRPRHYSGYSSLYILAQALDDTGKSLPGASEQNLRGRDDATLQFAHDPYGFLANMGAKAGPMQTIRSIYKVRMTAMELQAPGGPALGIVGYPIFIERKE